MDKKELVTLVSVIENIFRHVNGTCWDIGIWANTITLTKNNVLIGSANPKPETVQVAHVERSVENIKALEKAKNINEILKIFGKSTL